MTKNCVICNNQFEAKRVTHTTCSRDCSYENRKISDERCREDKKKNRLTNCIVCNVEFKPDSHRKKICSEACGEIRHKGIQSQAYCRKKNYNLLKANYDPIECAICKKLYKPKSINSTKCSRECQLEHQRTHAREMGRIKNQEAMKKPDRILNCVTCGKSFVAYASKQKNCSPECSLQYKLQRNRMKAAERNKAVADRVTGRTPVFRWLSLYKLQQGCIDCGYNKNFSVLQFDHVRGEKLFAISMGAFHAIEHFQAVLDEIKKCEVRCANCHAERHSKIGESGRMEDFEELDKILRASLDTNTVKGVS